MGVVTPPLVEAGFVRNSRIWHRQLSETCLVVEMLRDGGPAPCYTLEYGVVVGEAHRRHAGVAYALLRDRWGHFLAEEDPLTDWWVGFDQVGPFLTAYGQRYKRVTEKDLREVVSRNIIPQLLNYSTLSDIERLLVKRVDWVTGYPTPDPEVIEAWATQALETIRELRSNPATHDPSDTDLPLESSLLITVERTDPAADSDDFGVPPHFLISLGDEPAHSYDEDVDRCVAALKTFPGILDIRREDREVIVGWGTPDLAALEGWLRRWWARVVSE